MNKKYTYKLRPAYNSSEFLIEFIHTGVPNDFIKDLINILKNNGFKSLDITDVWMNDEIWIRLTSTNGKITITKDIWNFIFILGEHNQTDIMKIDEILMKNELFKKEKVDFTEYKLKKK